MPSVSKIIAGFFALGLALAFGCSSGDQSTNTGDGGGAGGTGGSNACQYMKCTAETQCVYVAGGSAACLAPCPDAGACPSGQSCGCGSGCPNCKNCIQVCLPGTGGGGGSSGSGGSSSCGGPSPAGCVVNPCPANMKCDVTHGCASSSCTCTPDGWACTNDCGGGECVPLSLDGGED